VQKSRRRTSEAAHGSGVLYMSVRDCTVTRLGGTRMRRKVGTREILVGDADKCCLRRCLLFARSRRGPRVVVAPLQKTILSVPVWLSVGEKQLLSRLYVPSCSHAYE
jgi:hypothetical protein